MLAHAAGVDAANASMRVRGRRGGPGNTGNRADLAIAAGETKRLLDILYPHHAAAQIAFDQSRDPKQ